MTRGRAFFLMVAATVCWGCGTAAADRALDGMSAFDLLFVELVLATALLWAVTLVRHGTSVPPRREYALLGMFEPALAFLAFNLGLALTSASAGALLMSTESVFVVVFAVLFLREVLARRTLVALALGVAGAAVVALGQGGGDASMLGNVLVVAGAAFAAGYAVIARRISGRAPAVAVTAWQFLFASLMLAPVVAADWLIHGSELAGASATTWAAAAFAGVFGSAIGFLLYLTAIDRLPASTAGVLLNLIPLVGLLAAVVVLGERPGAAQLAGGAVILAGVMLLSRAHGAEPDTTRPAPETGSATAGAEPRGEPPAARPDLPWALPAELDELLPRPAVEERELRR